MWHGVQIDSSLLGNIDFVIKLRIQGAIFKVRVVEEYVRPRELDNLILEYQMDRSAVASACHTVGGGPAMEMFEGLDNDDSGSGASDMCHQEYVQKVQGFSYSTRGICILERSVIKPLVNTTLRTSIPSIAEKVMGT
jgi:hypothetical protein